MEKKVIYQWIEELRSVRWGLRNDGIMHILLKENTILDLEQSEKVVECITKREGHKAFPNLVEPLPNSSINKEARVFSLSEKANKHTLADGILVKSVMHRIIANAFVSFKKPVRPTKIFTSEEEALTWLRSFQS